MCLGKAASLRPSAYLNNSLQAPYTSVSSTCGYSSPICSLWETVKISPRTVAFNRFLLSGAVVRAKKPVYWCATCGTALAEAEVDYADHSSPSIYVKFPVVDDLAGVAPELAGRKVQVLIWTTTPWTLPANLAVAFHPDLAYAAVEVRGEVWILASELVGPCMQLSVKAEASNIRKVGMK